MTFAVLIENIVSMNAAQSETPFGSKVRKGMFRTVSQLYKVTEFLPCILKFHSDIYILLWLLNIIIFFFFFYASLGTTFKTHVGPEQHQP